MFAVCRLISVVLLVLAGPFLAARPKVVTLIRTHQSLSSGILLYTPLDSQSNDPLRSKCMQDTSSDVRSVLAYLREMVLYSREANRRDLVHEYEEAIEIVASRMFGKLPPMKEYNFYCLAPDPHRVVAEVSRQVKKVLRHVTRKNQDDDYVFIFEELECGHLWPTTQGVPLGQRRQCNECPKVPVCRSAVTNSNLWAAAPVVDESEVPQAPIVWTKSKTYLRKITGRYWKTRSNGRLTAYERLECGHEQMGPTGYSILHKSRRCYQCRKLMAASAKKKPASVKVAQSKAVSA